MNRNVYSYLDFHKLNEGKLSGKKLEEKLSKIPTMWQLESKLKSDGLLNSKQALTFYCPVYFKEQQLIKILEDKKVKDEVNKEWVFRLPPITDKNRIKSGLKHLKDKLGINSKQSIEKRDGDDVLIMYSILPGIEAVVSDRKYSFIAYEAVQLASFSIVPKTWVNSGDPYNESYAIPGEKGYSPYWRIPPWEEFKSMRPDLAESFKETKKGIIRI